MKNNNKWKRISSGILAVCLVVTLLLSNQSFGVFAEEDTDTARVQESQVEGSSGTEGSIEEEKENSGEINESGNANESEKDAQESEELDIEKNGGFSRDEEKSSEVVLKGEDWTSGEKRENDVAVQSEDNASVITFDLAKGSIKFTDDSYAGFDSEGKEIAGTHDMSYKYEIMQSNQDTATSNTISVGTEESAVTKQFNIYLAGINICVTSQNDCPIYVNPANNGKIYLILKNNTTNIAEINYANGSNVHAAVEKAVDSSGLLCIACEEGYKAYLTNTLKGHECSKDGSCGKLLAYANKAKQKESNGPYVSGAGIGSKGYVNGGSVDRNTGEITVSKWLDNITIAGGIVSAFGAAGDTGSSGGGAGIGTGSCYNSADTGAGLKNFYITGGYITAKAGDDSASCIGGGYRSNEININIYNGTVIANERITTADKVRGTGIGAGGGGTQSGSPSIATVKIHGGDITASSQYGAAIGGAGSGDGTGSYTGERAGSQPAKVYIYGGAIQATSTGNGAAIGTGGPYGNTTTGRAGDATVEITGGSVTAKSESGADIGGGGVTSNSASSNGGNADITISGGQIEAQKGGIGGGLAVAGTGGDAKILVNGGRVFTPSIGGGNSTSNNGGSAEVNVLDGSLTVDKTIGGGNSKSGDGGDASICVSGGILDCASIGGGNSGSGKPGSVTSDSQTAGVVVKGGTLKTGTIGGGTNQPGAIGFATAEISDGNIQGQFILANTDKSKKCFFHMTGGTIDNADLDTNTYQRAQVNGGAVYLTDEKGEVSISGGTIRNATAELGGAVYMTNGSFELSGDAEIQNCTATGNDTTTAQGGAVYLDNGTVTINGGCILSSSATQGGAVYLKDGTVTLSNGTIGIKSNSNKADEGAGVYVAGGELIVNGGSIEYNEAKSGAGAYLQSGSMEMSSGQILNNISSENGAGAYLAGGTLEISSGIITGNTAKQNGGGVFLNDGNMTLSGGRIYSNSAVNGAGAYLNSGNLTISGGGDFDLNTASEDGGGAYLAGGALKVESGTFNSNTASAKGGGAYLAGGTLTITGGSFGNNTATNGGGAYAADGKIRMFGGNITNNIAKQSGGGFYVSSDKKAADVIIRSGTISGNKAGNVGTTSTQGNGGAIAVIRNNSTNANRDRVVIGLRHQHLNLDMTTRKFTSFEYNESIDNDEKHTHVSCPTIKDNQATGNGGGIYMNSSASILDIYCLLEENNTAAKDPSGGSIMSEGGKVNIGDIDEAGIGKNDADAKGNVFIQSPMLVKGGDVRICGNAENPCFAKEILVDIQKSTEGTSGTFKDERLKKINDNDINYVIEYFENFEESGAYKSLQYDENTKIYADGSLYSHVGYKILGWATKKDATTPTYKSGELINYDAWKIIGATGALQLYAIWQRISYTVEYYAGENITDYTGKMDPQRFEYGVLIDSNGKIISLRPNTYKVKGKRFVNWKTEDGTVIEDKYDKNDLTQTDGATVKLYAQWKDCTHDPKQEGEGHLSYTLTKEDTITETCDCGGYTTSVTISGEDVYYDEQPHPAILRYSNQTFVGGTPTIEYYYKANEQTKDYGQLPDNETVPTTQGYYKASVTIGECTASVTYQIKSPAEAATIDVTAQAGQHFDTLSGNAACTVTQEDAFTIRFNVQGLNRGTNEGASGKAYSTAPVLTLSEELPSGTTIIMQTENSYWYDNNPSGTTIELNNFKKMGGEESEQYAYTTENISDAQEYRFIIDFSDVNTANYLSAGQTLTVGLKYVYSYSDINNIEGNADKEGKATLLINPGSTFAVSASGNVCTVTAPTDMADTRWAQKNLVWMVNAKDSSQKLPEDAKLTMTTKENEEVRTVTCMLNKEGKFIIPFTWEDKQECSFSLNTSQEGNEGINYILTATLCVGSMVSENAQPVAIEDQLKRASSDIHLTVPTSETPALKIGGTQRVLSKSDTLHINITYNNIVTNDSVRAIIQKKTENGYEGNFSEKEISQTGDYDFSMQTTQGFGNYRVWVTVSNANGQTLLEVPYYFIVQE